MFHLHFLESSTTALTDQAIELNFVRNRLETFQATVLRDVQKRMSGMIDEVMQELRQHELQANEFRNFATPHLKHHHNSNTWSNRIHSPKTVDSNNTTVNNTLNEVPVENDKSENDSDDKHNPDVLSDHSKTKKMKMSRKPYELPEKVFIMRESFLTALLEVDHMKTIYHIFYIIFLVFLLNNISYEYLVNGR